MSRILAVTWDGGGNVPPMLAVAGELRSRGHELEVLGHPSQRDAVAAAGLPFSAYAAARPHSAATPTSGVRGVAHVLGLFSDPGPGRDVRAAIGRERPDLVLVDCLLPTALRAAQEAGVPTVVLGHTFGGYLRRWARGPMGLAPAVRGSVPTRLWAAADLVLLATDPELDAAGARLPNAVHTGPAQPQAHPARAPEEPVVLVSLSTVSYSGLRRTLQRVLDAVAPLPVRVLVTTGPVVDPAQLRAGRNTEVVRNRPHIEVMPAVSAVVSHGGHATALLALAHDLPLLVLPLHPLLDHRMVGNAVAGAGAGRVLSRRAPADRIRHELTALLADDRARAAAARIGARLRAADGAATAADQVEKVLSRR